MPESYPYGAKVLIDAMQAQKACAPSAAAVGSAGPSALAMAKTADTFNVSARRPGAKLAEALKPIDETAQHAGIAKLAEALKPIGETAQHGALAELMSGVKSVGPVAGAAENLRRATDGCAHPFRSAGMMNSATGRSLTDALAERARPSSNLPVPRFEPPPNYTAELLGHQRQAEARRAEERAIEDEWRQQSLAVQRAMCEALLASEAARAADAEAAAGREQALVDRATAAEDRAEAADKRQRWMLWVGVLGVGAAVFAPFVPSILV